MLAANVCASDFLQQRKHPALYRVHEGPTPEKLEKLRSFLAEFGFDLPGGDDPHASDYARLLDKLKGRPDVQLLQTVMLRSLRQAVYSPDNVGHFGLAYESYTHFTSPIRRYPDLLVHRAIKAVLTGETYRPGDWDAIGSQCSTTERRADDATRDVVSWLKCYFMQDKVGEEFSGCVSSVVPFGLFVALDDIFIEGLVHISDLGSDYFHFDEARHELVGERSNARYRLSDRVRVQVVRVDMETNKIDFRLVEGPERVTERSGKTASDRAARAARAPATEQGAGSDRAPRGRAARSAAQTEVQAKAAPAPRKKKAPAGPTKAATGTQRKAGSKTTTKAAGRGKAAKSAKAPGATAARKGRKRG